MKKSSRWLSEMDLIVMSSTSRSAAMKICCAMRLMSVCPAITPTGVMAKPTNGRKRFISIILPDCLMRW